MQSHMTTFAEHNAICELFFSKPLVGSMMCLYAIRRTAESTFMTPKGKNLFTEDGPVLCLEIQLVVRWQFFYPYDGH